MTLQRYEDDRGIFQELHKSSESFVPNQISYITINPGQTRGGHYHKLLIEKFVVIEGSVLFTTENMINNKTEDFVLYPDDCILVLPNFKHTLHSINGAKVLILSSKVFDPNDTDTYRE